MAAITVVALVASILVPMPVSVAAMQEHEPEIVQTLGMINTYRRWLGIEPLTVDPHLQQAAEAHVEYFRLNFGDPSLAGMGLHYEVEGRPGFTGVDFQDRAAAAGYDGWVNENAGLSGSMLWTAQWSIATVGHRLTLLDPRYKHVGLAAVDEGDIVFEIIDLGAPQWVEDTTPEWAAWPPAGTTGVGLSYSGEAPNPFPGADYPVGYPITLKYFGSGALTLARASITRGDVEVPAFAEIGTGWLSRETVLLCAAAPLEPGATYAVAIEGSANGQPFRKEWSFTTAVEDEPLALDGETGLEPADPGRRALPAGVAAADPLVQDLWWSADSAVALQQVERSWLWGPDTWAAMDEQSIESPGGQRRVFYFDKARMEVNPVTNGESYITAGLLVRDMVAGLIQIGLTDYLAVDPANVPLAGDPFAFNPDAPTYASLKDTASIREDHRAAPRPGQAIAEMLSKDGSIVSVPELDGMAAYGSYEATLGHNIATVFDDYLATLAVDWRMSVGLPIAEPYWVRTNLAGAQVWVLVQVFERRVLTYTPANRAGWQVEMGNAGRHYYTWRYGQEPPG
jgi:hypothetical protein